MTRINKVCSWCKSDEIYGYTTIYWDIERQHWEQTDDFASVEFFCGECGNQCRVEDVVVPNPEGKS